MFGYQREELLGQLIEILVPESLKHRHSEHRERYAENPTARPMGIGLELFARRKDGSEFPVEISLSPLRSADGSPVMAIVRDITDRKEIQARIDAVNDSRTKPGQEKDNRPGNEHYGQVPEYRLPTEGGRKDQPEENDGRLSDVYYDLFKLDQPVS